MGTEAVEVGEVVAGRYRIDRELGSGAMGVVYAAWHLELDYPVAVKVLASPLGELGAATERFRREVRAAAKIRSEHVARVLDVGTLESGVPYMVLELLDGQDLEAEINQRGPLPIEESVSYMLQAIEALSEAHVSGIVHRDLKPANLFLAKRADRTRIIKVLDFGISKSLVGESQAGKMSLTQTGMILGSPFYMSPEQMKSTRDVDARTDIWAIGVILYQLITAELPFHGQSIPELCAVLFRDTPTPPSKLRGDIPPALEQTIMRCLQRDPDARFANVCELGQALVLHAPRARIHSERASRVLFPEPSSSAPFVSAGGGMGGDAEVRTAQSVNTGVAPRAQSTAAVMSGPDSHATLPAAVGGPSTQVAWTERTASERARGPWLLILWAAGGLAVLASASFLYLSLGDRAVDAPVVAQPVVPPQVVGEVAAHSPPPGGIQHAEAEAPGGEGQVDDVHAQPSSLESAEPPAPALQSSPRAAPKRVVREVRAKRSATAMKVKPVASARGKTDSTTSVPNYGGRR